MSTTFASTTGGYQIAGDAVVGFKSSRATKSVQHDIPGAALPTASLRPATARRGVMRVTFQGATGGARSKAAEDALALPLVWACTSTDQPTINMTSFAVMGGDIVRQFDPITLKAWWVEFPYQEIS